MRKKFMSLGLANLFVLAAMFAVAVSSASASQYVVDGSAISGATSWSVTGSGTLTLTHVDLFGITHQQKDIGTSAGKVWASGSGSVTTITTTTKTNIQNCTTPNAVAANTPWSTSLSGGASPFTATITNAGGNVGWTATCSGITVTCTNSNADAATAHVSNWGTDSDGKKKIQSKFETGTNNDPTSCSDGRSAGSSVVGTTKFGIAGHDIEVS